MRPASFFVPYYAVPSLFFWRLSLRYEPFSLDVEIGVSDGTPTCMLFGAMIAVVVIHDGIRISAIVSHLHGTKVIHKRSWRQKPP